MPFFETNVDPGNEPISSSFAAIKMSLDPNFSYTIFAKESEADKEKHFPEIIQLLSTLKKRDAAWRLYRDEAGGRYLLVVKTEPCKTDIIMKEILETGLPKDVVYYLYRCNKEN